MSSKVCPVGAVSSTTKASRASATEVARLPLRTNRHFRTSSRLQSVCLRLASAAQSHIAAPKKPSFRQISPHEFGDALFGTFEPDITTAIINGRKPPQLTAQTLMRLTPRLPAGWAEQRKLLGFR